MSSLDDQNRRIEQYRQDLDRLRASDRSTNLVWLALVLLCFWGITLAALLGFLR